MTRKAVKRKKTTTSRKSPRKVARPKLKTSTRTSSAVMRSSRMGRVDAADIGRAVRRSAAATRRTAYYTMGALALGLAILILAYGIRSRQEQPQLTTSLSTHTGNTETSAIVSAHQETPFQGPLAQEFTAARSFGFQEKIQFWSSFLEKDLDGRERLAKMMEGRQVNDTAPVIPEKYDCATYVETVAALARSQGPSDFFGNLIAIRYKNGEPGFIQRNHFPEVDWIPNNAKAHILSDITSEIAQTGGIVAKVERKKINRAEWLKAQVSRKVLDRNVASLSNAEWAKPVEAKVPYIEISQIQSVLNRIPSGTVLNLVHKDDHHHPVLITHQGFVIREGDKVLLRHASRGGRIRTNELYSYLRGLLKQQRPNSKWPLIGVNLNQINASTSASNLRSEAM